MGLLSLNARMLRFMLFAERAMTHPSRVLTSVLVLAVASACHNKTTDSPAAASSPPPAVPVTIEQVRAETLGETVTAIGTVMARESVTLTAKVSEIVERVHFESGQEVARGTPLVTLSGQQQQAALNAALANAEEAERLYQRGRQLVDQQLIARASFDGQVAARDATRAQVAQIRAQLAERVVRAPFSGVLGIRQVSPGALVTPGTVIATLDDISRVYVDFPLPETQIANLHKGLRLNGTTAAWPDQVFEGVVTALDARLDPASRAVTVRAEFPNPSRALKPGMLVNVTLYQEARKTLVVPEIAVMQIGRESSVWKVGEDGKVSRTVVETGTRTNGQVEIRRGLVAGERIVGEGVGKLREGQSVRAVTADAGTVDSGR